MGLGYSISMTDPTILSANISEIRAGLDMTSSTASFVASLATLALAAAVLGAGALGDLYGKKRLFVIGSVGAVVFNVVAATAPNSATLMVARAGAGVGFALLLGLSLAIVNDVFPPERRAAAISLYLGASFAFSAPQPAIGSLLAEHFGWRTGFLVAPVVAVITLLITLRYVPETPRAPRKPDLVGVGLVAVALLAIVYGISRLAEGLKPSALVPIIIGLIAAAGFVIRELRTPTPALDLHIFRSKSVSVAVSAGVTKNFLTGGCTILFAYYIVAIRGESPALLGLLLVPATILQAFAAIGSGRLADRIGNKSVLVIGLALLLAGLLVLTVLEKDSPMVVLFTAIVLICLGGAVVQTPQSTIMMSSAPPGLSGAVAALKSATGQAGYSLGPTLFALIGTAIFVQDGARKLAVSNITEEQAREALRVAHGGTESGSGGTNVLDPDRARAVVAAATDSMVDAIHTLSFIMAAVPIAAIILALVLLRPDKRSAPA
ncbi:MFS transporter [Nocardiaceae bacterium YC2-7]|uniref:MFS transporter n=2 Tax=Antrihabitans stalactiti TaxID=2584121 RepID=A0A848KLU1_9NOCA|nr:MFS transporter [Antrihabitans stalactiti]